MTERRGAAYEGFWRTTRPSVVMPGRFFHDHGIIRRSDNGLLEFKVGGAGLLFDGWLLLAEGQLFAILFDTVGQTPIFVIWNGVPLSKASLLDGVVMAAALNAARTPSAYPIVMERIGDLSGDRDARSVEGAEAPGPQVDRPLAGFAQGDCSARDFRPRGRRPGPRCRSGGTTVKLSPK